MSKISRLLLCAFGYFIAGNLFALHLQAQTGNISGTISDASRRVLVGAQVQMEGRPLSTISDESGRYTLLGVSAGSAKVKVSYLGFESSSLDVAVTAGARAGLVFRFGFHAA